MKQCLYCQEPIKERFYFCLDCFKKLPLRMQELIPQHYDSRRENQWIRLLKNDGRLYLGAIDKEAFTWECAKSGAEWAIQELMNAGKMSKEQNDEIWRQIAEARKEDYKPLPERKSNDLFRPRKIRRNKRNINEKA